MCSIFRTSEHPNSHRVQFPPFEGIVFAIAHILNTSLCYSSFLLLSGRDFYAIYNFSPCMISHPFVPGFCLTANLRKSRFYMLFQKFLKIRNFHVFLIFSQLILIFNCLRANCMSWFQSFVTKYLIWALRIGNRFEFFV